jgi:hypothetical protein
VHQECWEGDEDAFHIQQRTEQQCHSTKARPHDVGDTLHRSDVTLEEWKQMFCFSLPFLVQEMDEYLHHNDKQVVVPLQYPLWVKTKWDSASLRVLCK